MQSSSKRARDNEHEQSMPCSASDLPPQQIQVFCTAALIFSLQPSRAMLDELGRQATSNIKPIGKESRQVAASPDL